MDPFVHSYRTLSGKHLLTLTAAELRVNFLTVCGEPLKGSEHLPTSVAILRNWAIVTLEQEVRFKPPFTFTTDIHTRDLVQGSGGARLKVALIR